MRKLLSAAWFAITIFAPESFANPAITYKLKHTNNESIQNIFIDKFDGISKKNIDKINVALNATNTHFKNESKQCGSYAQGHPWGYRLNFDKILLSKKYLSVVFSKFTVCAGSPIISKEARVFSIADGNIIPAKILFKKLFPRYELVPSVSTDKNLIDLNDEMIEIMIEQSKAIENLYDSKCEFYLKNISYKIWINDGNLVLFPEFIQTDSFCQKEYFLHIPE